MATTKRKSNFISKIVKDPANPPKTVLLRGYLGDSSEAGHTRLYLDAQLNSYMEVPDDAILHEEELPGTPQGESYVWIKQDAQLIHGEAGPQRTKATFFEGPIGAVAARPPFTPVHVCPITQICPVTEEGCPPPTALQECPPRTSFRGCPLPTPMHLCPSNPLVCPVVTPRCPPPTPLAGCPNTQLPACPATPINPCQMTPGCPVLTPACPPTNPINCPPVSGPNFCFTPACPPTNPIFCPPVSGPNFCFTPACPSVHVIQCPTGPIICQPTPVHGCPTLFGCPSLIGCPSGVACGQGFNPGGGINQ